MEHPQPVYLPFTSTQVNATIKDQFIKEACGMGLKELLTKHKKDLRLVFFKTTIPDVYLVMVVGQHDRILIELAQKNGFPRGFPILWIPGVKMQYFGFYPKFDNDDRQTPDDQSEFADVVKVEFFKKWSGFLGQLMCFTIAGQRFWTVTSKNSAADDSPFVADAKRLFEPFVTPELCDEMIRKNLHICAEVMSKNDQTHGSKVYQESPIVTSIGYGCLFYLDKSGKDITNEPKFVNFLNHVELVDFCVRFKLPCDSAVIINNQKDASEFIQHLSHKRDSMNDSEVNKLLAEHSDSVKIHKGTVLHADILGNCLEGLVLKLTHVNGSVTVKKYKFPGYTHRTMLLRTVFQNNFLFSMSLKDIIRNFCEHWCVTPEGKQYWFKVALQEFMNKLTFKTPDPTIGDHIHLAEAVTVDPNVEEKFNELAMKLSAGTVIICIGPIGSGKTTIASTLAARQGQYVVIDGDLLDWDMPTVMKLGKERAEYSRWLVVQALLQGKIPIISAGGGIFFGTGKQQNFVLRDQIYATLGIIPNIILMVPGNFTEIVPLDNKYNPEELYNDTESVKKAVARRLATGEWTLDSKFKKADAFCNFIADKSKKNLDFAVKLIATADHVFGFPIISEKNYGIQKKLDCSSVLTAICPTKGESSKGKFGQIRVLVMIGDEVGHITYEFSAENNIDYDLAKFSALNKLCDSLKNKKGTIPGQTIALTADAKTKLCVGMTMESLHDDDSTHITLDPGQHAPKEMKSVVKAFKSKAKNINLPVKNSPKTVTYDFGKAVITPCDIVVLGVFGI